MAEKKENTRFGSSARDIAQDFAEQLKYALDADVYHTTAEGRCQDCFFSASCFFTLEKLSVF